MKKRREPVKQFRKEHSSCEEKMIGHVQQNIVEWNHSQVYNHNRC
jgi:hypothetical protein